MSLLGVCFGGGMVVGGAVLLICAILSLTEIKVIQLIPAIQSNITSMVLGIVGVVFIAIGIFVIYRSRD